MMNHKRKVFVATLMITLICFFTVISAMGRFTALSYGSMGNAEPVSLSVVEGETFMESVGLLDFLFEVVVPAILLFVILTEIAGGPDNADYVATVVDLYPEYQHVEYTDVLMAQLD